jgi:pSer/pThr/pTyr-binding forkhead associated (FHA) protein
MAQCDACGANVDPMARFCSSCGKPQGSVEIHPTDTMPAINVNDLVGTPQLIVTRGANAGSKFALDQRVTRIGRHPNSDIFLDDVTVSREHAEVTATAEGITIRDVGSLNGTYLNGLLVEEARLSEGDSVQIGKYKLLLAIEIG